MMAQSSDDMLYGVYRCPPNGHTVQAAIPERGLDNALLAARDVWREFPDNVVQIAYHVHGRQPEGAAELDDAVARARAADEAGEAMQLPVGSKGRKERRADRAAAKRARNALRGPRVPLFGQDGTLLEAKLQALSNCMGVAEQTIAHLEGKADAVEPFQVFGAAYIGLVLLLETGGLEGVANKEGCMKTLDDLVRRVNVVISASEESEVSTKH